MKLYTLCASKLCLNHVHDILLCVDANNVLVFLHAVSEIIFLKITTFYNDSPENSSLLKSSLANLNSLIKTKTKDGPKKTVQNSLYLKYFSPKIIPVELSEFVNKSNVPNIGTEKGPCGSLPLLRK